MGRRGEGWKGTASAAVWSLANARLIVIPAIARDPRMRRIAAAVIALSLLATPLAAQAPAPTPQSWLYGAWIGGMFQPPVTLGAQECLAQPMLIVTRDVVMRAVLTSPLYPQRQVETVRATANGFEIRFLPRQSPSDPTFGCPNPDVLPVQRQGENQIMFPGCTEFPFPLIRCGAR